jgi:hypothetical protein
VFFRPVRVGGPGRSVPARPFSVARGTASDPPSAVCVCGGSLPTKGPGWAPNPVPRAGSGTQPSPNRPLNRGGSGRRRVDLVVGPGAPLAGPVSGRPVRGTGRPGAGTRCRSSGVPPVRGTGPASPVPVPVPHGREARTDAHTRCVQRRCPARRPAVPVPGTSRRTGRRRRPDRSGRPPPTGRRRCGPDPPTPPGGGWPQGGPGYPTAGTVGYPTGRLGTAARARLGHAVPTAGCPGSPVGRRLGHPPAPGAASRALVGPWVARRILCRVDDDVPSMR